MVDIPPVEVASILEAITHEEGPVHLRVATRRIAKSIGASATSKAVWSVKQAAEFAKVRVRSDYLYPLNYCPNPVRDHSTAPDADRKLSFVPPLEIEEAIMETLRRSFKISDEDAMGHALRPLGFKKLTMNAKMIMGRALQSLIDRGRVASDDGVLSIPDSDA